MIEEKINYSFDLDISSLFSKASLLRIKLSYLNSRTCLYDTWICFRLRTLLILKLLRSFKWHCSSCAVQQLLFTNKESKTGAA